MPTNNCHEEKRNLIQGVRPLLRRVPPHDLGENAVGGHRGEAGDHLPRIEGVLLSQLPKATCGGGERG